MGTFVALQRWPHPTAELRDSDPTNQIMTFLSPPPHTSLPGNSEQWIQFAPNCWAAFPSMYLFIFPLVFFNFHKKSQTRRDDSVSVHRISLIWSSKSFVSIFYGVIFVTFDSFFFFFFTMWNSWLINIKSFFLLTVTFRLGFFITEAIYLSARVNVTAPI